MPQIHEHLDEPVSAHLRTDFPVYGRGTTVGDVLRIIRQSGLGDRITYFYVTDDDKTLSGVVPTRRLLQSDPSTRLEEIMITRVVCLPRDATVFDACDLFITHRFLALPVVDDARRLLGVVDVNLLTEEVFDVAERREADEVFQWIGVRLAQVRTASSPLAAFRYRAPWLLVTLAGGLACAAIAGMFEATLKQSVTLAMFFAVALGLGESVAIQSMTLTMQRFQGKGPTKIRHPAVRELLTAIMLGCAFGALVMLFGYAWRRDTVIIAIGISSLLAIVTSSIIGMCVPMILHRLRRDPQVAAGPVTLALSDASTSLLYFGGAALALH